MEGKDNQQWFNKDEGDSRKKQGGNRRPQNQNRKGKNAGKNGAPRRGDNRDKSKTPGPVGGKKAPAMKPSEPNAPKKNAPRRPDAKPQGNHKASANKQQAPRKNAPAKQPKTYAPQGAKPVQNKKPAKKRFKLAKLIGKKNKAVKQEKKSAVTKSSASEPAVTVVVPPVDSYKEGKKRRAKKASLRNGIVSFLLILMAATVLMFVIHHLYNYIAAKPELSFISEGSIEHTIGARALIVRHESVVPSGSSGDLVTQVAEGSRIAKGQNIAMVVPAESQTLVADLRNLQSQISDIQQELIENGQAEGAGAIYTEINGSIEPIIDMMRSNAMNGNISDLSSYSSSIMVLLNQRESELSELTFDDSRLRTLRSDAQSVEARLEESSTMICANEPGIVSYKLDGQETELSFDMLLNAEPSEIRDRINSSTGLITSDLYIEPGENVARIAQNEKQYIACFLDGSGATVEAFSVGSLHTINVGSEGISIGKCQVERVQNTNNGILVVFSTTRYVEELLDLRTVDIEVVINESSGLRVPMGCLVNPDFDRDVATIYVNNEGFCDSVDVIIVDNDREFAIITPIGDASTPDLQTVIITNPSSIKPGEKVEN